MIRSCHATPLYFTLYFLLMILWGVTHLGASPRLYAQELEKGTFFALETGYQSSATRGQQTLPGAWDSDLSVGAHLPYATLKLSIGASLSQSVYQRSQVAQVESYFAYRLDAVLFYRLDLRYASLLLGGGIGFFNLTQDAIYRYKEGDVITLTSEEHRTIREQTNRRLVRLSLITSQLIVTFDYDFFSLNEQQSKLSSFGFNVGVIL